MKHKRAFNSNPTRFKVHNRQQILLGHQDTVLALWHIHLCSSVFKKNLQAVMKVDEMQYDTQTQREGDKRHHVSRVRQSSCVSWGEMGRDGSWLMMSCWLMPMLTVTDLTENVQQYTLPLTNINTFSYQHASQCNRYAMTATKHMTQKHNGGWDTLVSSTNLSLFVPIKKPTINGI